MSYQYKSRPKTQAERDRDVKVGAVIVGLSIILAYKCGKSVGVHSVRIPVAVVPKTAQLIDDIVYLTMSDNSLYTARI